MFNKEKVYKILLTPIICDKNHNNIGVENNIIYSSQKYCKSQDEDMSDFSLGFYEILYKDFLKNKPLLDENGKLYNEEFAGDTMYSFNTIANMTDGAGNSRNNRTNEKFWPEFLQKYYHSYHCLANFWIIPMYYGRWRSVGYATKENPYDSPDLFLEYIENNFGICKAKHNKYFNEINDVFDFCKLHFFNKLKDYNEIKNMYTSKTPENIINYNNQQIENRAKKISESDIANELYDYFYKVGIL